MKKSRQSLALNDAARENVRLWYRLYLSIFLPISLYKERKKLFLKQIVIAKKIAIKDKTEYSVG